MLERQYLTGPPVLLSTMRAASDPAGQKKARFLPLARPQALALQHFRASNSCLVM
jgi:hypothetical protein